MTFSRTKFLLPAALSLTFMAGVASAQDAEKSAGPTRLEQGGQTYATFKPERMEPTPREFTGVGVNERMNTRLPLETTFRDDKGERVSLGQYFRSGRPVVLQFGYYGCPKLCDTISQGTANSLIGLDLELGKDYQAIFISVDPNETPELARKKKQTFVGSYAFGRKLDDAKAAAAANGWHFLTGRDEDIKAVAGAAGYQYKWVESAKQYSHPAVVIMVTPEGVVSRYLYGVQYDPKTMRLSLVDAAGGKVGSIMDQIKMICFHFDPNTGQYSLAAMRVMQLSGVLTVLCLASTLGVFALKSRRTRGLPPRTTGLSAVLHSQTPNS